MAWEFSSLVGLLQSRAEACPGRQAYVFLHEGEEETARLTFGELDVRARALAVRIQEVAAPGDRALLLFPPGLDFIAAFFGCLYAGVIAVPAYPPRQNRRSARLESIAASARPRLVLTTSALLARTRDGEAGAPLAAARWLAADGGTETDAERAGLWRDAGIGPETVAFLQYTSGSTADPKGVVVSHRNLLHNERMIRDAFRQSAESVIVGWLPLYHDMGLIGNVLQPLYLGATCVLMSPLSFLQRPEVWLRAISRYRGTTSGGPNFAYDLCVRRVGEEARAGLDLSSWTLAFNGAEPVRAETLDAFAAAFAPCGFRREAFYPCYGLAEATLFVSGGAGPLPTVCGFEAGRPLVSCGQAWHGQEIAVVDPDSGRRLGGREVGEIWVAGPSVAQGYWELPEATERTFGARLDGSGDARFLRTGDLGFLDGGELYVTGRIKELIILRGRNHYPQDLERTAERGHPALRPGCSAAFAAEEDGEERLVLVCEIERRREVAAEEVAAAVRRAVAEEHEVQVHEVALLRAGSVPKTSSGKIQRLACRADWLGGRLPALLRSRVERAAADPEAQDDAGDLSRLAVLPLAERRSALLPVLTGLVERHLRLVPGQLAPDRPLTALGLDSLAAVELQTGIADLLGVAPGLSGLLQGQTLAELADGIAAELAAPAAEAPVLPAPPLGEAIGELPLSHGQRGLWLLSRMDEAAGLYHIVAAARAVPDLDPEALRRALSLLAERHPALRTTFFEVDGEPRQRVRERLEPEVFERDATTWNDAGLRRRLEEEAYRPFDLEAGPLLRAGVFTRAGGGRVVLFAVHHLVADFWSLSMLARELGILYGRGEGEAALEPPLRSYSDFVRWQEERLAGPEGERLDAAWRQRLAGAPQALALPTDRPRLPVPRTEASSAALRFGPEVAEAVRALARERGTTVYVALLAAFTALLHRTAAQDDLLVGSPALGRRGAGFAGVAGYFVNPLVLRSRSSGEAGDPDFATHLAAAREEALWALEHQDWPLPLLVERLQPVREPGRSPLFQVLFVFQRSPREALDPLAAFALGEEGARVELGELALESLRLDRRVSELDLSFAAAEADGDLALSLTYRADLFDAPTAMRLLGHLRTLTAAAAAAPETRLGALPLLTEPERAQLLVEWTDTAAEPDDETCIHDLVREQAGRTPEATAVVAGDLRITFGELERRARALAERLEKIGVGPEVRVGVFLDRTAELPVALLGVLRSGGAYVPLDPAYPPARLAWVLEDAGVAAVVTRPGLREALPGPARGLPLVLVDHEADEQCPEPMAASGPPGTPVAADNLAYLIYTSGSTGRPKGVAIRHRSAVTMLRWARQAYTPAERAGVLASTSVAFDLSVFELFVPLAWGGTVILAENALGLPGLPAAGEVTLVNTVPSAMAELLRGEGLPASVRVVNLAGEALPRALADALYAVPTLRRVDNLYGPSEDTTYSTGGTVGRGEGRPPTIGRPLAWTRAYLLDARLAPVPLGVPGELYLGGRGLARGYLGRPELTAERFVPDPLGGAPGERLYRTGDLVRFLPDGRLDFLGRADHQIKLRGFRIELGEIEAALAAHPAVREAAVVVAESPAGPRLVAWLTAAEGAAPAPRALRAALAERLPEHMLPSAFQVVEALPLSPNGKVDRRRLAEWSAAAAGDGAPEDGERARTSTGEILAGIWAEVLGREKVGAAADFFDLGGHSLLAAQVASRVRRLLGVELPLRKVFELPRLEALAAWLEAARSGGGEEDGPELAPVPRDAALPLSFAQQRLWFLDRLEPGGAAYNVAQAVLLEGPLDVAAFARGLGAIVARHEVLRTTFAERDGRPVQVIHPAAPVPVPVVDLGGLPDGRAQAEARALARQEAARPFDLGHGPLLRTGLVRLGAEEHLALVTLHHVVCDGWSLGVLLRELAAFYGAFAAGRTPALPALPVQYADFAAWQRRRLEGERLDAELGFWRRRLAGAPPVLELPADRPRPPVQGRRGAALPFVWPAELAAELRRAGRREGATFFMVLLAGFQALLGRYTGETDLPVGTPVAGRPRVETEGLIGFFVNTLVLRGDLSGEPSFRELLGRAREVALEAEAHQELPFERLVEELQPERSLAHAPLFQVMFALQNAPGPGLELPGLRLRLLPEERVAAKFDLTLSLREDGDLAGSLEYAADLFDAPRIERLAGHLRTLLAAAAAEPDRPFTRLPLLTPAEREGLLRPAGPAAVASPEPRLHDLVAAQAARTPDAVAVVHGDARLTYAALLRRADALARRLRRLGVGPEARVGVFLPRDAGLVWGLLGILRAGGAYAPLDIAYPEARLAAMAEDAGLAAVLTTESLVPRLPAALRGRVPLVRIEEAADEEGAAPESGATAGNLAYLIFTSGSTGRPKAVAIEHRSAVALVGWAGRAFADREVEAVLAATSISFDLSVFELFVPLACGGRVVMAENALELPALPAAGEVTLVNTVPSALSELLRLGPLPASVRTVNLAGEPLPRELADRIYATPVERLLNLYGPSEDTTYSTGAVIARDSAAPPPIGAPIDGTRALVLDQSFEPVPAGVPGEILLGGAGLARGYVGRPDLTAERFVPDPYAVEPGARVYRTGDLGRWLEGEELEYLGRADQQVKLRGFRIELGEIEAALAEQPGVREAAVVVAEAAPGDRRLVAFVVPEGEAPPDLLRAALGERLPAYMVPAVVAALPELPHTPNGKVDRRALRALAAGWAAEAPAAAGTAPRTPVEQALAEIWAGVLGRERVGIHEPFFDLGGHSLLATQVVARVRRVLGVELPLRAVFEAPTVAGFAARVEEALGSGTPAPGGIEPLPRGSLLPLSYAQQRLWFLAQLEPESPAYNIAQAVHVRGDLDPAALARALAEIVLRHEPLRTAFPELDGQPVQEVGPPTPESAPPMPLVDLGGLPEAWARSEAERLVAAVARLPFDVTRGPLLRTALLRLGRSEHLLVFSVHHIVSDGWSMGVVVRELAALYAAGPGGTAHALPPLPVQYADWAVWQRRWLEAGALEEQLAHWRALLAGSPGLLELPTDRPRSAARTLRGAVRPFRLPRELAEAVRELGRRQGATLFMTLLAAFQVLLARYASEEDVSVGTPIAGRRHEETEGLVGFFVNTLVLRADLSGAPGFAELLARAREATLAAYAHQDVPFDRLVEELHPERSLAHAPLVQALFALQNAPARPLELPGLTLELRDLDTGAVKLDLALSITETDGGLAGRLSYRTDLFLPATMARLAGHFESLLAGIVAAPERRIGELPLLAPAERAQVVAEWNDTRSAAPAPVLFHEAFAAQAARVPDAVALVCEEVWLSYGELARQSGRLALRLRALGVGPDVPVGLLVERSAEMVVGLLAALRAGGAYVPLDPAFPRGRIAFVLDELSAAAGGAAPVVLTTSRLLSRLPEAARPVFLDREEEDGVEAPAPVAVAPENLAYAPENLAYVIYTSGSTGWPKGVAIEHRQLASYVRGVTGRLGLAESASFATVSTIAADLGNTVVFPALATGGCLHVVTAERAADAEAFAEYFERHAVGCLKIVPSHLAALLATAAPARALPRERLVLGGEASSWDEIARLRELAPGCRVFNHYGPTETTVGVITHAVRDGGGEDGATVIPLGRPLPDSAIYLLGPGFEPVPAGVPGELCIGGAGLARGYLGRPDLTAERFVPSPFGSVSGAGARLYRSGDLARFLPDGRVTFLGRIDRQVKIRGFRVDPGEVAAVLAQHPAVREAVVLARGGGREERRLAAWVVPAEGDATPFDELREALRERLPDYMIPAAFVRLAELPLTPNGKLDERALPAPDWAAAEGAFVAPRTPVEELLAGIWCELLGRERCGAHDDFFALGGHSLLATRLASRVRQAFAVELPLRGVFEAPTLTGLAQRIESLRRAAVVSAAPPLAAGPRPPELPLSYAQERLWFLDQLEPGLPAYNLPYFARVRGPLEAAPLAAALNEVVRRHEALRTRFPAVDGRPVQAIAEPAAVDLPVVDLGALPAEIGRREAERLAGEQAARPFDLAADFLARPLLVRLDGEEHLFLLTLHHAVSDAWSRSVLAREIAALYPAAVEGRPSPLPEPRLQVADFALWQRGWLQGATLDALLEPWRARLAGAPPLDLPTDRPRPALRSGRGGVQAVALPAGAAGGLARLARGERSTLFMVLLAAWQGLLHRLTGQADFVIGAPVANRNRSETEELIGFFVNTLALRADLAGRPAFREALARVRTTALEAYDHQDVPFEKVVEAVAGERALDRAPLFQAAFLLQEAAPPRLAFAGLEWEAVELHNGTAKFDLTLAWMPAGDGELSGLIEYDADLFEAATAARLAGHLASLIEGLLADPGAALEDLPVLTRGERAQLAAWNATGGVLRGPCLHELFVEQARRTPEAEALVRGAERLTYRELHERAEALARRLRRLGVGPEERVGICLERSVDLVVSLLATLLAGGAYVPLDPAYPGERLGFMVEDAAAAVVVTRRSLLDRLPEVAAAGARALCLDATEELPEAEEIGAAAERPGPGNLAYLIYTSGSTGRPKAVAIEHRSAVAFAGWAREAFTAEELAAVFASTSISFDLSVFELFVPLAWGGKVVLGRDALELPELPAAGEVTLINTVPSALAELLATYGLPPSVRTVNLAGEPLPRPLVEAAYAAGARRVCNLYGPSEDTTYSTWTQVPPGRPEPPTIGGPVAGSRAHVLDAAGHELPVGVPGELFLAGEGLARGYLGRPELTAERFVPDPFSELPGARLYRTGDLVRRRPGGELDFLGRIDHQVKMRGFRIELGEVEAALLGQPGVREAAVLVREGTAPGDRRLVAFVAAEEPPRDLRTGLAARLPAHMVPSVFVPVPALPRTPNGKVDRRALAALPVGPPAEGGSAGDAPRTAVEEVLAAVWEDVLGLQRVGRTDDFFALGGHSLLAARVAARLRETFGVDLPLRALFEAPTLAALAAHVEAARAAGAAALPPLEPAPRDGALPVSFSQQRLWLLDRIEPGSPAYHMAQAVELEGRLDAAAFAAALSALARRHEALRTTFSEAGGEPVQVVGEARPVPVPLVDLSALPEERRAPLAARLARDEAARPFSLERGPLLRAALWKLGAERHLALVTLHHVISDGWSLGVLLRDLGMLYAGEPDLPELPVQPADHAVWQRRALAGVLESQLAFWRTELDGVPLVLELPSDRPRRLGQGATTRGGARPFSFDPGLTARLRDLGRRTGATLFMTLMAGWQALLARLAGRDDLLVGTPVAGRRERRTEDLIGCFVNTLVLRGRLEGEPGFGELLRRTRDAALDAFAHQDLPFERLVEELQPDRRLARLPVVQVALAFQNAALGALELPGLTLRPVSLGSLAARFELAPALWEAGEGLEGRLDYDAGLFDTATAERWLGHLAVLLEAAAAEPLRPWPDLPLLDAAQRHQVELEWGTAEPAPEEADLAPALFARQAERTPDATALATRSARWTYAELDRRADRLAGYLRGLGVGPEARVAVCLERSPELVAALLAVWKAGGAFVPLDPGAPVERLAFLLEDAAPVALVTSQSLAVTLVGRLAGLGIAPVLPDLLGDLPDLEPLDAPETANAAGDLAYLLYTSGTTGRPKGVMVEHGQLRATLRAVQERFAFDAGDAMLHLAAFWFDIALFELLAPLLAGGTSLLLERDEILDVEGLAGRLAGATRLHAVPSLMQPLVTALASRGERVALRTVFVGGERVPPELLAGMERVFAAERVVLYGPTEAAIVCAGSRVPPGGTRDRALVGRPLPGVAVRLADTAGRPVPPGVAGEIWIGGPGVARGYRNREDLTREKFVRLGAERFYRSGDLARHLPDGALEFLGRIDDQVKIRGQRVEPGEVEGALAAHPDVAAAVVLARPGSGGEPRLVAWVVPAPGAAAGTLGTTELRDFLRRALPEALLPSACVVLDALPLLSTGKVDRRALPEPEEAFPAGSFAEAPPRTPIEQVLAGIWSEVLGAGPVGARDDFFALGGHSLLAVRVASRVRALLGVDLPLRDLFERPTVAALAARIEELRGAAPGGAPLPPLEPVPRDGGLPLSFAQERLWFLDQIRPGSAVYNVAGAFVAEGELHRGALAAALSEVVRRHEALRTVFLAVAGAPVQAVVPARPVEVPLVDLGALPAEVREAEARELARGEARRPFDLGRGPLLRAALLRLAEREHVALVSLHHIATDGWSMRVFADELAAVYRGCLAGRPAPLPPPPVQYADYAVWQRRQLAGTGLAAELAFWRERLAGAEPAELAADRPRPAERTPRGDVVGFALPTGLSRDVRALGRRQGATSFMVLLAAFQALLARSTGRDDLSVGTPVAGRSRLETEGLIGFFVNLLVLRSRLAGDPEAAELLRRVREDALESLAHQDVPFDRLVQELRPERTLSHTPLFQVLFVLQNARPALPDLPGLRLRPVWAGTATAKFDLTLALEESADGFRGRLEYAGDLFDRATAVRLLGHFENLLAGMAAEPGRRLSDLPLLSEAERHQLEREWADTAAARRPACIHTLVEEQAARTPDAVAVVFEEGHLTYGELDRRANRLAHRLLGLGVGPEVRVGVHLERSAEMVIALLAVLKAGGAYVPIDPTYPAERVTFMAGDARARVLLTRSGLPEVAVGAETAVVLLDNEAAWAGLPASRPGAAVGPDHLAYVIYTSGSTGRPKGAMNAHRGVVNRLLWMVEEHGLTAAERFLQKTPYSFDVSVWELFCPLIVGARLVVAVPGGHHDPLYLARRIAEEEITTLHFAPSMLQAFLEVWSPAACPALRRVVCSGEALPFELQQSFLAAAGPGGPALHNLYGPTEAAIEVTAWACAPDGRLRTVPIGRPIANARVHLLDRGLRPVGIGVPGELFIGGRPVARGYLDRPDLTAERFVPDPFAAAGEEGARLYRTGDLARHLPSGAVEFLGRLDHQVKIRGLRIELGEIETALAQHPGVREAVVVARRGPGSEPRLTAYFVPRQGASSARVELGELREHLRRKLPDYMVPAAFLSLDAFPLSPSGKVDRRALPEPGAGRPALEAVYVPPTTPAEERLAAIWREVLGLERIGVHDNFFELGGDSILSIRIVARAHQEHVFLTPRHLFQYQTIAELAAVALQPEGPGAGEGSAGFVPALDEPLLPGLGESDLGGAFDEIEFEGRLD